MEGGGVWPVEDDLIFSLFDLVGGVLVCCRGGGVGATPVVEFGLVSLQLAFPDLLDKLLDCLLRLTYMYIYTIK